MSQEIKTIGDRGRQQTEAMVRAFQTRSSLRPTDQQPAHTLEIERLQHEREVLSAERDAAHQQLKSAAQFCNTVPAQPMEHQQCMIAEARNLSQHAAKERGIF
eukprot:5825419-Amphidinium_carterae.1